MEQNEKIRQEIKSLLDSEIRLGQIAENIEQVFWLRELRTGRILYVSPAFETVWGRPCESLYANPLILIESVHPEDRVQVMVADTYPDHKPFNQAYRILRPDGSLRWISARIFSIRDETGTPTNLFYIAQDIPRYYRPEAGGTGAAQNPGPDSGAVRPQPQDEPGAQARGRAQNADVGGGTALGPAGCSALF